MGQSKSKEKNDLSKTTHFSKNEVNVSNSNVKDQVDMKENGLQNSVSNYDHVFLKRLYAVFGGNEDDFSKFTDSLNIFIKGTPEEKLKQSFKLYDIDKDGYLSKEELENVMLQLSQILSEDEDQSEKIQTAIDCMFQDFDVDGDGKLSFEEYKLSTIKEPLVADFIDSVLDKPKVLSRPTSVGSKKSPTNSQNRLSFKLSQAELLDYSHQHQVLNISEPTPTHSPRSSAYLPLTPVESNSESTTPPAASPTSKSHRLSRGASMASLDAAMISM